MYNPPSGNSANFSLESYTPPAGNAANFELGSGSTPPPTSETKSSSFLFDWIIRRISKSYLVFDWVLRKLQRFSTAFKWVTQLAQRRYNLVTYPLFIEIPTVSEFTFSAVATGTLDTLAIDFSNTGTSGNTTIELYVNDSLITTYSKTADNNKSNEVLRLDNNNIAFQDKLKLKITSVADNIGTLHLGLQTKSFTEKLEVIKKCNVFNSTEYEEEIFYGDAELWNIYLNQPLSNLIRVYAKKGDTYYSLAGSLGYDDSGRNLISITADKNLTNYDEIGITAETEIDYKVKEVIISLRFYAQRADYPSYIYESFTFDVYLAAIKLYYSWDNKYWFSTDIINSSAQIDNLPSSAGNYTLYLRYYYDLEGRKVIHDQANMIYNPNPIDVQVNDNQIEYNDPIPLDKVEVYTDGELQKQIEADFTISGFDDYSFQSVKTDDDPESTTAEYLYADPTNGDDTNDGTYDKPYEHLYKAIQESQKGTIIILKKGTYNDESSVGAGNFPLLSEGITIRSETRNFEDVIVYANVAVSEASFFFDSDTGSDEIKLEDFTVIADADVAMIQADVNSSRAPVACSRMFFDGKNIRNDASFGRGVSLYKCTLRNFIGDSNYGTLNQIAGKVYDNIFENITYLAYKDISDSDYNCLYNVTDYKDYTLKTHDITDDPKFTDSDVATLQSDSPCKDAGITVSGYVENYGDSAPDMGCYEFNYISILLRILDVTNIDYTSATLNGTLTDLGGRSQVKVWFEWGETDSYGNSTSKQTKSSTGDFSAHISGLKNNTYYFVRVVASNIDDTNVTHGDGRVFLTKKLTHSVITLSSGIVNEKDIKYSFDQQDFIFDDIPDWNSGFLLYTIGFNNNTKKLELKKSDYSNADIDFDDLANVDYIPIWKFTFNVYFPDDDNHIYNGVFEVMEAEKIFYPVSLPDLYGNDSTTYKFYDVSGKTKTITFNNTPTGSDYMYYVMVKDSDGNIIKRGQITQLTTLTYDVEPLT